MIIRKKLDPITNKRVFIAGHSGMVGSAVLNYFISKGLKKIITVSSSKLDLRNKIKVEKFFKKTKPQIVINCAAKVGGIKSNNNNKVKFIEDNIEINNNIFKSSFNNNIHRLIYLGSSCVYPKNYKRTIKEEDLLSDYLETTNEAYSLAKIVGLKTCHYYNKEKGTDFRAIMPCNLFGPKDNYDLNNSHVLPAIIKKISLLTPKNNLLELWGSGNPKREFLYVKDLAKEIFFLTNISKKKFEKYSYKSMINIGSKYEFQISHLAKLIAKILKKKIKIKYINKTLDGTKRKKLNYKRFLSLKKDFKQMSFEKSLLETYDSFLNEK